jgi:predicted RNase H-related nuclease YkuK (DUF458 family)
MLSVLSKSYRPFVPSKIPSCGIKSSSWYSNNLNIPKDRHPHGKMTFRVSKAQPNIENSIDKITTNKFTVLEDFDDVMKNVSLILEDFKDIFRFKLPYKDMEEFRLQVIDFFTTLSKYPKTKLKNLEDYEKMKEFNKLYDSIYMMYLLVPSEEIREKLRILYTIMNLYHKYANGATFSFYFPLPKHFEIYDEALLSENINVDYYNTDIDYTASHTTGIQIYNYYYNNILYIDIGAKTENPIIKRIALNDLLKNEDLLSSIKVPNYHSHIIDGVEYRGSRERLWDFIVFTYQNDKNCLVTEKIFIQRESDTPIRYECVGNVSRFIVDVPGYKFHHRSMETVIEDVD